MHRPRRRPARLGEGDAREPGDDLRLADLRGGLSAGFDEGAWITTSFGIGQMLMGVASPYLGAVFGVHRIDRLPPSTGGTVGTVVNHIGFTVPNVQEAVAKWKAAGVPFEPGAPGRLDQGWVTTTDGLKIEIQEDKDQKEPTPMTSGMREASGKTGGAATSHERFPPLYGPSLPIPRRD